MPRDMRRQASFPLHRLFAVLLVLLVTAAACGDDDEAAPDGAATTATNATTTTTAETTTTSAPSAAPPDRIAAVLGDGNVVLLDGGGRVERTLLEDIQVDDPTENAIAMSPDGEHVLVVRPDAGGQEPGHEILRVPTAGGEPEVVVRRGSSPALSPDGRTLAYVAFEERPGPSPTPLPVVVLHDVDSGEEHRLSREEEPQFHFIAELSWGPDGERLALIVGEIGTGLYVVERGAEDLDQVRRLGPELEGEDSSWDAVAALDDGRLAVVETCCDIPNRERWRVIAVDVETGAVQGDLLPEERVEASRIDSDPSNLHLLLVTNLRPGGGALLRWSSPEAEPAGDSEGAGELQRVRDDVVVAAW